MSRAPVRLVDQSGLPPAERALLEAAGDGASLAYDVEAGAARFRANLAALAATGVAAGAHGAAQGSSLGGGKAIAAKLVAKVLLGLAAGASLVGGGFVIGTVLATRPLSKGPPQGPVAAVSVVAPRAAVLASGTAAAVSAVAADPGEAPSVAAVPADGTAVHKAVLAPSTRTAAPAMTSRSAVVAGTNKGAFGSATADSRATGAGSTHGATAEASARTVVPATSDPATSAVATSAPMPSAVSTGAPGPSSDDTQADSLAELRAIAVARNQVDQDPEAALATLDKLGRDHPHGYFVEERRALTVLALSAAGRTAAARQQGATFLRAFPNGPFSDRVRAILRPSP